MEFKKEPGRIYKLDADGKLIAEITYEKTGADTYDINHTFVDDSLRGQGVAGKLVEEAVHEITGLNGKITASCSYASSWLQRQGK